MQMRLLPTFELLICVWAFNFTPHKQGSEMKLMYQKASLMRKPKIHSSLHFIKEKFVKYKMKRCIALPFAYVKLTRQFANFYSRAFLLLCLFHQLLPTNLGLHNIYHFEILCKDQVLYPKCTHLFEATDP